MHTHNTHIHTYTHMHTHAHTYTHITHTHALMHTHNTHNTHNGVVLDLGALDDIKMECLYGKVVYIEWKEKEL